MLCGLYLAADGGNYFLVALRGLPIAKVSLAQRRLQGAQASAAEAPRL